MEIDDQHCGMIVCMSAGIKFFQKAEVVDPDDASKIYCFDLDDPQHCACFNIGTTSLLVVSVHRPHAMPVRL